jgi:hypothetical protein
MAVKGSGALSIATDIVGEFGGVAPHSLSEYYGGGTYVPAGANPGIATSGAINFGSHYGAVAATVLTISSNVNNYDIGAAAIAAGGDKSTPVILTINAGVTVGSTSSGTAAMFTGTGWSSGTTINITNNGSIVGASGSGGSGSNGGGGRGGKGGYSTGCYTTINGVNGSSGSSASATGQAGGNAFTHSQTADNNLSVIFDTAGTRSGGSGGTASYTGGGGGGGGGGATGGYPYLYAGGGGGGGARYGSGGAGSYSSESCGWGYNGTSSSAGSSGGATSGGGGGSGGQGANGGRGGNLGSNGSHGSMGPRGYGGGAGSSASNTGSAGSALSGNTSQIS